MHLFLDEILMKFINWLQKKNKPLKKKSNYLVSLGKKCLSNSKVFLKKKIFEFCRDIFKYLRSKVYK